MFTRDEAKAWNEKFYTLFGTYMRRHTPQAEDAKQWLNYRTHVKGIYLRVEAQNKYATASIDIQLRDADIQELLYQQFQEYSKALESYAGPLLWDNNYALADGRIIGRIYQKLEGVNLFKEEDWHTIFPFFEKYLLAYDAFWANFREGFINLAE